jgi:hypothetical protein
MLHAKALCAENRTCAYMEPIMELTPVAAASAANFLQEARTANEVRLAVLKKALTLSESQSQALLEGLPQSLPLQTEGKTGRFINQLV